MSDCVHYYNEWDPKTAACRRKKMKNERSFAEFDIVTEPDPIEAMRRVLALVGSAALAKSTNDPFDYSLKLRTGEVIRYHEATVISCDWLHPDGARLDDGGEDKSPCFDRGIDVRISDIVWAKDAPYGS